MHTARIRRTLVAGATTLLLAGGATAVAAPAHAEEPAPTTCVSQEQYDADVAAAKDEAVAAKQAFRATLRPWGKLVREERREARGEIRTARREMRDLVRSVRKGSAEDREAVRAQLKSLRKNIQRDLAVLRGNRAAIRVEIRVEQRQAFRAWKQERVDLREARAAQVCEDTPTTDEPTTDEPTTDEPTA